MDMDGPKPDRGAVLARSGVRRRADVRTGERIRLAAEARFSRRTKLTLPVSIPGSTCRESASRYSKRT